MIVPNGYITTQEMFDLLGRERHASAWTGVLEHSARANLTTIEQYEIDCKTPGSGRSGMGIVPRQWTPEMSAKMKAEIYSDTYQAERLARNRYDDVFSEFLRRLECGEVKAAALDKVSGKLHAVAPEIWRTVRAKSYLAKGVGPAGDYYRNREGELFIVKESISKAVKVAKGTRASKKATPKLRGRGRPNNKTNRIVEEMSKMDRQELAVMSYKTMEHTFKAAGSTFNKAREIALAINGDKSRK